MLYTTNAYILDPDIAIPYIIQASKPQTAGPIYDTLYISIDQTLADMHKYEKYFGDIDQEQKYMYRYAGYYADIAKSSTEVQIFEQVSQSFFKSILPMLDIMKWNYPLERIQGNSYYKVKTVIDSITYMNSSNLCKQYYITTEEQSHERYKINNFYANLAIPPRGLYIQPIFEQQDKTIVVRGQVSIIKANSTRMLLRLRDGSLLELFEENYNPEQHKNEIILLFKILDKIMAIDPDYTKRYMLAFCHDTALGRPAYRLSKLFKLSLTEL